MQAMVTHLNYCTEQIMIDEKYLYLVSIHGTNVTVKYPEDIKCSQFIRSDCIVWIVLNCTLCIVLYCIVLY